MTATLPSFRFNVDPERLALSLLVGQSTSFGLTCAFLVTAASSLFLVTYGPQRLPWVYMAVALSGAGVFYGYGRLQQSWPSQRVWVTPVALFAGVFIIVWLLLQMPGSGWVSFPLMIAFSLLLQVGFVVLGGQAGRLFDIRQIKRRFPLIVTGFVAGFMLGGLAVPPLVRMLGGVESLLLAAALTMAGMLVLILAVVAQFADRLRNGAPSSRARPSTSIGQLLRSPFTRLILGYQMLSAMGSQLLDFMVLAVAAARFVGADALAQFFGNYTALLNLADLLFVALLAGFLLTRFGMGFGLTLNPGFVGVLLIVILSAGLLTGTDSLVFFLLVAAVRISDLAITDGTTRTSINTAYQALPASERDAAQTLVEGVGVPLALGLTGVVLLLFTALFPGRLLPILLFTLAITLLWTVAGWLVYLRYGDALLGILRRRAVAEAELALDDGTSLATVERLLHSERYLDVRLGLDMLDNAGHPSLPDHLGRLLAHPDPEVRIEALGRIEQHEVRAARARVRELVQEEEVDAVRGAAIRTLCALSETDEVMAMQSFLDDGSRETSAGALVGLLRYGGIPGVLAAGEQFTALQDAADASDRQLLARVIAEVAYPGFYQPLVPLLSDENAGVRREALLAAARVRHSGLLPGVVANLAEASLRSAAAAVLVKSGELVLPIVTRALAGETEHDTATVMRLARICGQIGSPAAVDTLKPHIGHRDAGVRLQVLAALAQCRFRAEDDEKRKIEAAMRAEIEHAVRVLQARQVVATDGVSAPLARALAEELAQIRQRLFLLLSFLYESRPMLRAGEQIAGGGSSAQALAMETLDVTLASSLKAPVLALVDPALDDGQRLAALGKHVSLPAAHATPARQLQAIITNPQGVWSQAWTRACAIYAAGQLGLAELADAIHVVQSQPEHPIPETAHWALKKLQRLS